MQIGRMYSLECWYNGIYFSGIVNVVSFSFQNISSPEMGTYSNVFSCISVLNASFCVFSKVGGKLAKIQKVGDHLSRISPIH